MVNLTDEEKERDRKAFKKGRQIKWVSELAFDFLKYMTIGLWVTSLEDYENKIPRHIVFVVDGIAYWLLAAICMDWVDGIGLTNHPYIHTWMAFLLLRIIARLLIVIFTRKWYKSVFKPLDDKYLKYKNDFLHDVYTKYDYHPVDKSSSGDVAYETWEKHINDSTRTTVPTDKREWVRYMTGLKVSIKAYRDYGNVLIRRIRNDNPFINDNKFNSGIGIFDRDFEVFSDDEIKAKSFLSTTTINRFIENKDDLDAMFSNGMVLTVKGDRIETVLDGLQMYEGSPNFAENFDFRGIDGFLRELDSIRDSFVDINRNAETIERMIRSESI